MKQTSLLIILSIFIMTGCNAQTHNASIHITEQQAVEIANLKIKFMSWDKGEITESEAREIMESLVDFLISVPELPTEVIQNLSPHITVYEMDRLRIVQYIENPNFYGSSGKGSYHIVMYEGKVEWIGHHGSMRIDDMVQFNDHLYYIYATDYRFSNITGIQILSISTDGVDIGLKPVIKKDEWVKGFVYNEVEEILYFDHGHIYFKEIRNDGKEVVISANETNFLFILEEDGRYQLAECETCASSKP